MTVSKPFVVEGYEVPAEIEDAALREIGSRVGFQASEIVAFLLKAGVPIRSVDPKFGPSGPANRIADRLLQRERRAGRIEFRKGVWHPCIKATAAKGG